ncbi:DNA-binding NarL/FixJ family response regulator [Lipingzhangella halophila]|uniref:DNA-binding NarL/FixJ family response regulator n=1 Tax=Lipingzhangella halophila TaxID=1783352 RepID=A0A7W7RKU2_9ACTN|nr:response regulator transcription factor [Lipingzhangella halophila]MBB4933413.1 DNA-binding NarL/FixJ family response regulator [Lipingzhangella halophila]
MNAIRVLLVDDHELTLMGFRMTLASDPGLAVVGSADNGQAAIAQARRLAPDVVLMDVRMPTMDGIEATGRITSQYPGCRVLILTTFDIDEYAFDGLRAGASGFLLKDVRPAELLDAIRAIAAGDAVITPRITRKLLEQSWPSPSENASVRQAGRERREPVPGLAELTPREAEIMSAIAEGMTNGEIADRFTLADTTVKTYVGRILRKLGLRDRVQIVILAYETGLTVPGTQRSSG